jgi:hypothetical protein
MTETEFDPRPQLDRLRAQINHLKVAAAALAVAVVALGGVIVWSLSRTREKIELRDGDATLELSPHRIELTNAAGRAFLTPTDMQIHPANKDDAYIALSASGVASALSIVSGTGHVLVNASSRDTSLSMQAKGSNVHVNATGKSSELHLSSADHYLSAEAAADHTRLSGTGGTSFTLGDPYSK